jgi:hypothetical protein
MKKWAGGVRTFVVEVKGESEAGKVEFRGEKVSLKL